jgi:hypothetical protein
VAAEPSAAPLTLDSGVLSPSACFHLCAAAAPRPPAHRTAAVKEEAARRREALKGCPKLSPGLLDAVAVRKTVLLAAADWAAWDVFGVNWLAHVQRAGVGYYLVAALDKV